MAVYVPPRKGEKHLPRMNYAGPGTDFYTRTRQNILPMNKVDAAALEHDRWTEARGPHLAMQKARTKAEYVKLVREADLRLIAACKLVVSDRKASELLRAAALTVIAAMETAWLFKKKSHFSCSKFP